jgi:two-component system sensor histidine kinase QseC
VSQISRSVNAAIAVAAVRQRAAERIVEDGLRAGQVLKNLLTLARASHAELSEAAVPLDLVPLAARVLADCAQGAQDGGHELALSGSAAFRLDGHDVLLELALRNLIENALGHAPRGSTVEVPVDAASRWLQVTNEEAPAGHIG